MHKVIICGVGGRMGRAVARRLEGSDRFKIVAGIDKTAEEYPFPVYQSPSDIAEKADCIIDFSNPALLTELLDYAAGSGTPLVIATTGYSPEQIEQIKSASERTPIFFSANMSLGINLLAALCRRASEILGQDFDIEIIEKHHNQKLDAPSGTALLLADEINSVSGNSYSYCYDRSQRREKRGDKEIGISAIRGGSIVGEHQVIFAGADEVISLEHRAYSREVFASGAIKAAEFIIGTPLGLYSMEDIMAKEV